MQNQTLPLPSAEPNLSAAESLAYIAGIVDGEGSICISVSVSKRSRPSHVLRVAVYNTCWDVIYYINALLPGNIVEDNWARKRNPNHKTKYILVWYGRRAADVIELLLPYLIIKREVANLALEMWYKCFDEREGGSVLSEADIILRSKYSELIKSCNGR